MASSTLYRIEAVRDGWLAHAGEQERWFEERDAALRWCHDQAVKGGTDAAPEEGAYGEADIEIEELSAVDGDSEIDDGEELGELDDG